MMAGTAPSVVAPFRSRRIEPPGLCRPADQGVRDDRESEQHRGIERMTTAWRPAPESMIRAAIYHDYSSGGQPELTGYLLAFQCEHDGTPMPRRRLEQLMGWGSTKARKVLARAKADHRSWNDGGTLCAMVSTQAQPAGNPPATQPTQVESQEVPDSNPTPTRRQPAANPPSRAQSIVDRERTEQKTDDAADAWAALCKAVGREWNLDPRWRRWLTQGAKSLGGWDAWHLIARWVAEGGPDDGDAAFHRETRRDPETLIRASSRAKWHNQARDWAKSRGIVATAEKPKHNGKPAPQMPKDVKDYRYLMTMTHPWGLPKEITDLWEHEDSTYTWEVPPYED